jgi:hypothetical protein
MGIPILLCHYRIYAQPCVSPPNIRAKKAATAASKLPFNMSVTPLRALETSGSGKPRYGPPDAPLYNFRCLRYGTAKTGIPYPFLPFS